jgi:preprotein translocase subunit SecG
MYSYLKSLLATGDENTEIAPWIASSFPVIKIVIMCALAVLSIAMIVFVVMQKSNTNGVSAISGQSDTFYNKNKGATLQGKIKILTIIDAVLIMVLCIAFLIINTYFPGS